jgi:glycosyltransferase involved in cell wall biosynthesis
MQLLKFHVIVVPKNPGIAIMNREKLQRAGVEVYQSYDEALNNIKLRKDRVSSFWVARVDVAEQLLPRIKIDFPGKPVYFDTVDLHHLRDQRNIALNGVNAAIYGENIEEIELAICKIATKVIVVADYENRYLLQRNPELEVHTLFMPYEVNSELPKMKKNNSILFVGSFKHSPNLDAIEWLIDDILPKINNITVEPIHLEIVGEFLPISVQEKIDGDKIRYHGWLESLDSVYAETSLVVAPLRYGAGKKGKIMEAVVHGCPIVSTSIGVEGFPLISGEDFILADSAEEFAAAILKLLSDQQLSLKYADSAFTKIAKDSSFKSFVGNVASILDVKYPN